MLVPNHNFQIDQSLNWLLELANQDSIDLEQLKTGAVGAKISKLIKNQDKLTFILPAFPAKSSNRNKTLGPIPDYGEVIGLSRLNELCHKITGIYRPGAEVVICSDGRVFNDLVFVSELDLLIYNKKIKEIISKFDLSYLKTYDLADFMPDLTNDAMKTEMMNNFGQCLDEIKSEVKTDKNTQVMFNGIHRFVKDDMGAHKHDLSKNQLNKKSKEVAYQVIQRSRCWDKLLKSVFNEDTIRLSIHPYPLGHEKFGVKLVEGGDRWATPWHNVSLKRETGVELVKHVDALRLGAKLKFFAGQYAYYECA